ncbi:RHS repeat-associated core domain-containing protein [Pseudomonas chlororaphis]|uniref:RHS repeat-associated core domain-containing protein n=1 Tax=Pseudomonas chlororaphis TaxID=587753 RepID=UPI0015DF1BAF|nr:RHS repeat-associated core domain-containing protein [Pseudomonas chlororaphis]QLL16011.1 RHS repeat-associated core domain-containing protein [Pseudomonas chlororaphis subsp. aurantiaca]
MKESNGKSGKEQMSASGDDASVNATEKSLIVQPTSTPNSAKQALDVPIGFNGQLFDAISGAYLLGNGYRAYNPIMRAFYSPDSFSPFGVAGVNRYQYCSLDPINFVDPSGHLSWQAGVGIGLGVVGILMSVFTLGGSLAMLGGGALHAGGLGVTSAVLGLASGATGIASAALEESDPDTSAALGWASLGLGLGSMAFGGASAVAHRSARGAANLYPRAPGITGPGINPPRPLYGGVMVTQNRISNIHGYPFNVVLKYNGVHTTNGTGLASALASEIGESRNLLTLTSCFGGFGGRFSAAQLLANTSGRPVAAARFFHKASQTTKDINTWFTPLTGSALSRSNAIGGALSNIARSGAQGYSAAASGLSALSPMLFFQ